MGRGLTSKGPGVSSKEGGWKGNETFSFCVFATATLGGQGVSCPEQVRPPPVEALSPSLPLFLSIPLFFPLRLPQSLSPSLAPSLPPSLPRSLPPSLPPSLARSLAPFLLSSVLSCRRSSCSRRFVPSLRRVPPCPSLLRVAFFCCRPCCCLLLPCFLLLALFGSTNTTRGALPLLMLLQAH